MEGWGAGADPGILEGGGSKIKFMKGEGTGLGQSSSRFLVFHLFSMKIKALFIMIRFQKNLI